MNRPKLRLKGIAPSLSEGERKALRSLAVLSQPLPILDFNGLGKCTYDVDGLFLGGEALWGPNPITISLYILPYPSYSKGM